MAMPPVRLRRGRGWISVVLAFVALLALIAPTTASATQQKRHTTKRALARAAAGTGRFGELDCNNDSPIQRAIRITMACTDIRGFNNIDNANTWSGRFYDNGHYIGHDEPDMTFYSSQAGSGNDVTWTETLPQDPAALPTVNTPGSDITHWFELTPTPWFSMGQCDPRSYPETKCKPESDSNAPTCVGVQTTGCFPGGGAAFMEMQFYPPGFAGGDVFADSISCDNSHWCAALTIDSLECTLGFASCNNNCIEPVNFAFIQTNGVPAGPPSPQDANLATFNPNGNTLLMNPGDVVRVHMFDASVPGTKAKAFEVTVDDLTTGQSGYMQASARNGFQDTSITDCSGTPFNFQPEYNTAKPANITPWAALETNISSEYETGHFEPCTFLTKESNLTFPAGLNDVTWNDCHGPYEQTAPGGDGGARSLEPSDAPCYPAGDTHGTLNTAPDEVTGCLDELTQNGDLDFEGSPYWPDWPTSTTPGTFPGAIVQSLPTTAGSQYSQYMIQTDTALSESTCSSTSTTGCAIPPPTAPGQFYPYWSRVSSGGSCTLEFGNVSSGAGVNDLGQDAQYGTDQIATLGYPEFEGPVQPNTC
jgi:hypothetical protein